MRFVRSVLLFSFLVLCLPAWAQQTQTNQPRPTSSTLPPAPKEDKAVSILNQALAAAGGVPAIRAIKDYTASGTVTYHADQDVTGTVTMSGLGLSQFRMDSSLPAGVYSKAIGTDGRTGTKTPDGKVSYNPPEARVPGQAPRPTPIGATPYQPPMFPAGLASPYHQLMAALSNPRFGVFYKGVVEIDGHSVHDIRIGFVAPGHVEPMSSFQTRDFFVDVTTLQVLMTRDIVPKNVVHEIRYSDYRTASGILIPFSISEQMAGQRTWDIQLGTTTVNAGLQDSAFALQ